MPKKIKLGQLTNTATARHTVVVKLPLAEGEEELRVIYRGLSLRDSSEMEKLYEDWEDRDKALCAFLAQNIMALPDVINEEQEEVLPTAEFFETLDTFVLHRINQAIREDRLGNPTN